MPTIILVNVIITQVQVEKYHKQEHLKYQGGLHFNSSICWKVNTFKTKLFHNPPSIGLSREKNQGGSTAKVLKVAEKQEERHHRWNLFVRIHCSFWNLHLFPCQWHLYKIFLRDFVQMFAIFRQVAVKPSSWTSVGLSQQVTNLCSNSLVSFSFKLWTKSG